MPTFAAKQNNRAIHIFSFDFGMFCAILNLGRAQAACSSHKKVAQSTFSTKRRSKVTRAQGFTQSSAKLGRLLQMPNWTRLFGALKVGCGRAMATNRVAPALFRVTFLAAPLGWRDLWAISSFSLTVRAMETRANLAALVRPEIQKVRIC